MILRRVPFLNVYYINCIICNAFVEKNYKYIKTKEQLIHCLFQASCDTVFVSLLTPVFCSAHVQVRLFYITYLNGTFSNMSLYSYD